ncbi:unnamed protein product [Mytilus coruscus]|uniref:Uncharacterized protein n=1 Tax=Mytilus coruscus TaxID=42192 RepID=A0A6J8BVH3_MYTCO|nr:unnamed protein product [Mytilus coruscus]
MTGTVIYIIVLLQLTGKNDIDGCLTWDYDGDSFSLICRTEGSRSISLVDNHGQDVARCALNESSGECSSLNFVEPIIRENLVAFYIDRNLKTDINGNWYCLQQNNTFMADVLTSEDLTASTIVNLFGKIVEDGDVQRLLLTCSSCRIPKGKHVEFHINNSSEEVITFNNETGKCTSLHGECTPNKCNCSSSGNTFSLFLLFRKQMTTNANFSCEMKFEDKAKSVVFLKVPTLSFNGKEFIYKGTRTVKTKIIDVHNLPKDTENDTVGKVIAGFSTIVVLAIFVTAAVNSYFKRRRGEKKKECDEDAQLIDFSNSKGNKSICTDLKNKIESRLSEITDEIIEAESCLTKERNEIEISLPNHDEAQRTCPDLIDSVLKILKPSLKKLNELLTTITNVKKEIVCLCLFVEMDNDCAIETLYMRDTTNNVLSSEPQPRRMINQGVNKEDMFDVL